MTILMGVVANFPLALATGLGLNAFVAFTIVAGMTWADAMGLIVLEGLIILVLVLTGFRKAVFHAVPAQLKIAISVGIGLFIALIGFFDAGSSDGRSRRTRHRWSSASGASWWAGRSSSSSFGLLLMAVLYTLRVKGAILISILVATALAIVMEAIGNFGGQGYDFKCEHAHQPGRLEPHHAHVPALDRGHTRLLAARELLAVRRVRGRRRRDGGAVRVHAAAGRLLRHDGHDDRDRRGGGAARRRGHAAGLAGHPDRRLAGGGRRRGSLGVQQHVVHRVGVRRR